MLYGVLLFIKDNIDVVGFLIMVGSVLLWGYVLECDVLLVVWLWVVGVVILGKVNMIEWVNFMMLGMFNGYLLFGG